MSTSLILTILFILSNTFFLTPNVVIASTSSSSPLFEIACSDFMPENRSDLCFKVLQAEPKIVSAATNLSEALAFAIMDTAISNAENTRNYIPSILKEADSEPEMLAALLECRELFSQVQNFYVDAKEQITGASDYQYASGDLYDSLGVIQPCKKIERWSVLSDRINAADVLGYAAYNIVSAIDAKQQRSN